jgi:hypothetical protein
VEGFTILRVILAQIIFIERKMIPRPSSERTKKENATVAQQRVITTNPKEKTTPLLCRCPATAPQCCVVVQQQETSSNFSKNVSTLGTNKTTFGRAVMIPILFAAIRLTEKQTKLYNVI